MEFDEIVSQLKKEFETIKSNLDNKPDADNETPDSETKLIEILSQITEDSPNYHKTLSMISSILYEKAKVYLNMNLLTSAKNYLEKALEVVQPHINNKQITFIYLRVVNYLSYVLSRMGNLKRAKTLLEKVVNDEFDCDPLVYSTEDFFESTETDNQWAKIKFQKLKANNMQMLAWIYGKLGMTNLYAETIHKSLQKELEINDGDAIHWATRCYRLASLFIVQYKWENARYYLTAAQCILDPLEVSLVPNVSLFKAQADLARVWVSYGIELFGQSKLSVLEKVWDERNDIENQVKTADTFNFRFDNMNLILPNIPTKEVINVQEARDLFTHTHKWLKRARLFYTLRDYPLQYVNIILELSELYRYLAFYEKDIDSEYDVHKKRFDTLEMLSSIMREVRPSCYANVSVEIIREIMDIQLEMMNLNLKKIYNPMQDAQLNEEELKRRIITVNNFSDKIGKLCSNGNEKDTYGARRVAQTNEKSMALDNKIEESRVKEQENKTEEFEERLGQGEGEEKIENKSA